MNRSNILTLALLPALLIACSEKGANPSDEEFRLPSNICLVAGTQTRTTLSSGESTLWCSTDTLLVFDENNTGVKFTTVSDNVSSAVFTTENWTGFEPAYAACFEGSETIAKCTDGIISTLVPNNQHMLKAGSFGRSAVPCVGTVMETNGNYVVDKMYDVPALVKISFADAVVSRVKVEGANGENVAGYVDVDCSKLPFADSLQCWQISDGKSLYKDVDVSPVDTAAVNGCFPAGIYYVAVLPQMYEKGIRFISFDAKGDTLSIRKLGGKSGVRMVSGKIADMGNPLDMEEDKLPESFVIDLNFYNDGNVNPLGEMLDGSMQDATNGDKYYYPFRYEYEGDQYKENFEFIICNNGTKYLYTTVSSSVCVQSGYKILLVPAAASWIKTPAIPGRYLKSVTFAHGNSVPKQLQVRVAPNNSAVAGFTSQAASQKATSAGPNIQTITFPNTQTGVSNYKTEVGKSYYLYFRSAQTHVLDIKLEYTMSL